MSEQKNEDFTKLVKQTFYVAPSMVAPGQYEVIYRDTGSLADNFLYSSPSSAWKGVYHKVAEGEIPLDEHTSTRAKRLDRLKSFKQDNKEIGEKVTHSYLKRIRGAMSNISSTLAAIRTALDASLWTDAFDVPNYIDPSCIIRFAEIDLINNKTKTTEKCAGIIVNLIREGDSYIPTLFVNEEHTLFFKANKVDASKGFAEATQIKNPSPIMVQSLVETFFEHYDVWEANVLNSIDNGLDSLYSAYDGLK